MLLEQKVEVKWCPVNRKHYESLGYTYKHRGIIEVDASLLLPTSKTQIKAVCDYCGVVFETNNAAQNRAKYKSKHACSKCKQKKIIESNQYYYGVNSTVQIKEVSQKQMKTRKILYDKLYGGEFRECSVCKREYPNTEEYFPTNKNSGYGLIKRCRTCCNRKVKEIYRPKYKTRIKKYRLEHSDKINIYSHNRRAKKNNLAFNFSEEEWGKCKSYFDNKCAYCGSEEKLTQEHFIPLSQNGEYTKNNIIPVCGNCNSSKHDKDFFEWYPKQAFYTKKRERKILEYLNYDSKTKYQQLALC
jgi:5-methylcytosine-specific restriction endonuclease McrA